MDKDKDIEAQLRYETSLSKLVFHRLFNTTLMLAKSNLAFRGHQERNNLNKDIYRGIFLAQVNLLTTSRNK